MRRHVLDKSPSLPEPQRWTAEKAGSTDPGIPLSGSSQLPQEYKQKELSPSQLAVLPPGHQEQPGKESSA